MLEINYKLVNPNAKVPTRAYGSGDSCFDLYACEYKCLYIGTQPVKVNTGLIMEIPKGWGGWIWDRSGLALRHGVSSRGGVIDSNYRNEVEVILVNESDNICKIFPGDRIAQIDFRPVYDVSFKEIEEINQTSRNGGFGSSGK